MFQDGICCRSAPATNESVGASYASIACLKFIGTKERHGSLTNCPVRCVVSRGVEMKVRIEILRWNDRGEPKVLGAIQHESHSLEAVASAAQGVIESGKLPCKVDGFRIVTENGSEFFGWTDPAADLFELAPERL